MRHSLCTALSCLFSASKQLCRVPTGTRTLRQAPGRLGAKTLVRGHPPETGKLAPELRASALRAQHGGL